MTCLLISLVSCLKYLLMASLLLMVRTPMMKTVKFQVGLLALFQIQADAVQQIAHKAEQLFQRIIHCHFVCVDEVLAEIEGAGAAAETDGASAGGSLAPLLNVDVPEATVSHNIPIPIP